jgi:hypothetical protein
MLSEVETVQVTPVAEPVFVISAAVKELPLIASEKTSVKLMGIELVDAPPALAKEDTVGATLSCTYEIKLVQVEALFELSTALP